MQHVGADIVHNLYILKGDYDLGGSVLPHQIGGSDFGGLCSKTV